MENMDARNQDGTFKSGHTGFKPKGSVNEFQKTTREKLGEFLKLKIDDLESIYKELPAREKAKFLLAMIEFFVPKQKELYVEGLIDSYNLTPTPEEVRKIKEALDKTI